MNTDSVSVSVTEGLLNNKGKFKKLINACFGKIQCSQDSINRLHSLAELVTAEEGDNILNEYLEGDNACVTIRVNNTLTNAGYVIGKKSTKLYSKLYILFELIDLASNHAIDMQSQVVEPCHFADGPVKEDTLCKRLPNMVVFTKEYHDFIAKLNAKNSN